jgi:hypothetical protein
MNKGELRTHFKELLNRSDCSDALADTFIDQSITRIERNLRIPPMEKSYSYTISLTTSEVFIPSDFLEAINMYYANTSVNRVSMNRFLDVSVGNETGTPLYFTRQGTNFKIYPSPTSGSLVLNYYASFPVMTSDTDENDLALIASDLITYGALSFAADYFLDERGQLFESRFTQLANELQGQADDAESSGTVQVIQASAQYLD